MCAENPKDDDAVEKAKGALKKASDFIFTPVSLSIPCLLGWISVGSVGLVLAVTFSMFTIELNDQQVLPIVADSEQLRKAQKVEQETVLFREILSDVQAAYVDPVDSDAFFETGMKAMLGSLDPYTEFENNQASEDIDILTAGRYGGVGLTIGIDTVFDSTKREPVKDDSRFLVVDALEGYAWDAGLRTGDHLVRIDGQSVQGKKLKEITNMLRGAPGTTVTVEYQRDGATGGDLKTVLNRKSIKIPNVPLAQLLGDPKDGVGYVLLKSFAEDSGKEVRTELKKLTRQVPGGKSLSTVILDLRGNPGGLLNAAVDVAEVFLEQNQDVVSTKGRTAAAPSLAYASSKQGPAIPSKTKVVVLTSGSTASAAEIVAGAIQDHDRGVIVGEKTFGKGLVQQVARLPFDTSLKLTVAKYYTPSGRCIQNTEYKKGGVGREDEVAADNLAGRDFKFGDGSRYSSRKIKDSERKQFFTDKQRIVRDGGGIEPDVFVASDRFSELEVSLLDQNAFLDFTADWARQNPGRVDVPVVDDAVYSQFKAFVDSRGSTVKTRFDSALDDLGEAFQESKLEGLEGAIGELKGKARKEILVGFETSRKDIVRLLDDAFRARVEPGSKRLYRALEYDKTVDKAVEIAKNPKAYDDLLASGRAIGGPGSELEAQMAANTAGKGGSSSTQ